MNIYMCKRFNKVNIMSNNYRYIKALNIVSMNHIFLQSKYCNEFLVIASI